MPARLPDFKDRTFLITGASSGIGESLALKLAADGARMALVARRADRLEQVAEQARALGGQATVVVCDVADPSQVEAAVDQAERSLGHIDVLINNAGVGRHRLFLDQDLSDARRLLEVNLLGAIAMTRAVAPKMVDREQGWIVFMASIAGLLPVPGEAVYSASKFGLVGFSEALSLELEPRGVEVLTVCPGAVRTEFVPPEEQHRMVAAAERSMIEADQVAQVTLDGLRKGRRRVIVPSKLSVAVAMRGLLPSLVRRGTQAATREVVEA